MMKALEVAAHVTIVATVASLVITLYNGTLFAWHPILMSVGFLAAMTEGAITALKFRPVDGPLRAKLILRHFWIQLLAITAVAGGFWAIYQNKVNHGKTHFASIHGKFGLTTLLLTVATPLGGVVSFRKFGMLQRLPTKSHAPIKWLHRKAGLVTWLLALVTIELGLIQPPVAKGWLTHVWQVAVVLIGLLVCVMAATAQTPEPTLPQSQVELQQLGAGDKQTYKSS